MALLSDRVRGQVQQLFDQQLQRPVTVVLFHEEQTPGEDEAVGAVRSLFNELAPLANGKLQLKEYHLQQDAAVAAQFDVHEAPVLAFLDADGKDQHFRFWGVPMGYEFSSLLEDLVDVSKGETRLSTQGREAIRAIEEDVEILVFSTPG